MPQSDHGDDFEQAQINVRRAREMVERQREIVADQKAKGLDPTAAELRLQYFEQLLT
jgi:hypothetical protein